MRFQLTVIALMNKRFILTSLIFLFLSQPSISDGLVESSPHLPFVRDKEAVFVIPSHESTDHPDEIMKGAEKEAHQKWLHLLQDGLLISDRVKNSVERNRLKLLLKKIHAETNEAAFQLKSNYFRDHLLTSHWEWVVSKLKARQASIYQSFAEGQDKALIMHILDELIHEAEASFLFKSNSFISAARPPQEIKIELEASQRNFLEKKLAEVKLHLKDFSPSVFISYSWGPQEKPFVKQLAEDLKRAGINIRLDMWHSTITTAIVTDFVNEIDKVDYVIPICSDLYGEKYRCSKNNVTFIELRLISDRYRLQPSRIIPILFSENPERAIPNFLKDTVYLKMTDSREYIRQLSTLILALGKYSDDPEGLKQLLESIVAEASSQ